MPIWLPGSTAESVEVPPNPEALFLAQAWHELLDPSTPDSFKARVLDLNLLLEDLRHVAEVCRTDRRWASHLPLLAAELSIALDAEQRVIVPGSQAHRAIEKVIDDARQSRDAPLSTGILVAQELIGKAEEWLTRDLNALVLEGRQGKSLNKSQLIRRLSTIATHASYRGLAEECLGLITPTVAASPAHEAATALVAPLSSPKRQFTCVLALNGEFDELAEITSAAGLIRVPFGVLENGDPASKKWVAQQQGRFFVSTNVDAVSEYSSAETALRRVSEVLNVQCLHVNSAQFVASPEVLVKCEERVKSVAVTPSSHFGLLARKGAAQLTIERYSGVGARISGRLSNALEAHSLALGARDGRTALLFLWTALEAIAGSADGSSIGKRIAGAISPLVAWRRVDKIVTYLAICVQRMLAWQGGGGNREYLPRSKFGRVSQDDVLSAVTGENKNPPIMYLLNVCGPAPLLTYRLFDAWKEFSDPTSLGNSLVASKERIEWQIQRIYRARNLLVHRGEQSHLLWRLLQNAQYYVSITLSRVLHDIAKYPGWGIDESLAYQELQFNHVLDGLRNGGGRALTNLDVLGVRSTDPGTKPWAHVP